MKNLILSLIVIFTAQSAFAAPTNYELSQALVLLTNANNEADGPYEFIVCETWGNYYESGDFLQDRKVSDYLVLRKGGEIDDVFQVAYSVVTSYAFVAQSITRLNNKITAKFSCPDGTTQVYSEKIQ